MIDKEKLKRNPPQRPCAPSISHGLPSSQEKNHHLIALPIRVQPYRFTPSSGPACSKQFEHQTEDTVSLDLFVCGCCFKTSSTAGFLHRLQAEDCSHLLLEARHHRPTIRTLEQAFRRSLDLLLIAREPLAQHRSTTPRLSSAEVR